MKNKISIVFSFLFTIFSLLFSVYCSGQTRWTGNVFEQKVFIENKGQFPGEVVYKTTAGGIVVGFTKQGLVYRYDEFIVKKENEESKEGEKERMPAVKRHELSLQWVGSNPAVEITAEEKVSFSYNYSFDPATQKEGIKASAYKKIIYRNLYPNIDAEYVLPEKGGIKYSLLVRPGADISRIRMKWTGAKIAKDVSGNLVIHSSFGDFTDHAPVAFYENGETIPSFFRVDGTTISFGINLAGSVLRSLVIDPWITNPNITGYNAAYDVDYDFAGNVYAYGGDGWNNRFELIKMDASGAIQWVFVTTVFANSAWYSYYGDFAVDGYSGSIYIAEGMKTNPGCRILKLDPAGNQVGMNPGITNFKEIWRMSYNSCTKQGVLGGSGWDQPFEAALFDTTLTNITPVHMLGPQGLQDLCLLTIDNQNNCFMGFQTNGSSKGNQLLKCPANTLTPVNYLVGNDFEFAETKSMTYVCNGTNSNGMNGIAVNSADLFTYNGYKVKRHNKNTGAVVDSAMLTPPQFAFWSGELLVAWGGIAVDECNNIFVGSHDTIFQLDVNLNKVGFLVAGGNVYDLKLGPTSNLIYAAGKTFVGSFTSGVSCNAMTLAVSQSGSCASASATANPSGGSPPYTYLWQPGNQTTQTATGLAAGTYTVTVWDGACPPGIQTQTVVITSGALTASVNATGSSCLASNGSATVTPTGGTGPYTYSWSPVGGNNATASGLSSGSYTVTVTDATGCSGMTTLTITAAGGPSVTTTAPTNVLCFGGNNGSAGVTASGGTSPYTYGWSGGQTTSSVSNLAAGTYTVTVSDAAGCTQVQTVTITQPAVLTATVSSTPSVCGNNTGTAAAATSGGTGPYSYLWNSGQTTSSVSALGAGSYSVTVADANGCTQTATALVTSTGGPVASVSANVTISAGTSATLTAGGGGTYSWSNGDTGSPVVVSPAVTTLYCVTVTDTANCVDTACVTVYITAEPALSCEAVSTEKAFVLPSAFSPNTDGQNDRWRLMYSPLLLNCIAELYIAVYNRWGERVFEGTDIAFSWDGTYNGKPEGTAVFAYYLDAVMKDGTKIKKKGNITLLR